MEAITIVLHMCGIVWVGSRQKKQFRGRAHVGKPSLVSLQAFDGWSQSPGFCTPPNQWDLPSPQISGGLYNNDLVGFNQIN